MNKIYLLEYTTENLGDDIQTVAAMDILDEMCIKYSFVNRDLINGYFFNPLDNNYIIFNGWFTNGYGLDTYYSVRDDLKPSINITWPPKGNFKPILYSFHISEWGAADGRHVHPNFLEPSIDFYKQSMPVGCRDIHTLNILKNMDIDSYFSGCITLSLNNRKYYKQNASHNEILFVDIPEKHKENLIKKTRQIYNDSKYKTLTHSISSYSVDLLNRFELARRHLEEFCNAKLVITSRLHVALPCLAFGTPVILVLPEEDLTNSRLVDYIPYINVITHNDVEEIDLNECLNTKYDKKLSNEVKNKFKKIIYEIFI